MPAIKVGSFQEAKLTVLLHQSQQSEKALASNIVNLSMRCNRLTGEKVALEKEVEHLRMRAELAERELRSIRAIRYSSRRKRNPEDRVNT